jgi:hypothetical protein
MRGRQRDPADEIVQRRLMGVAVRAAQLRARAIDVHGCVHAQRREEALAQLLFERPAGDALDDEAEDQVPGVAVLELRARREVERLRARPVDRRLRRVVARQRRVVIARAHVQRLLVVRNAGGVMHELRDGDRLPRFGTAFKVRAERRVELQLLLPREIPDGECGEGLGQRGDLELRLRRRRHEMLEIRVAVALAQQHLPLVRDEDGAAELPEGGACGEILVEPLRNRLRGERQGEENDRHQSHGRSLRKSSYLVATKR